MTKTYDNLTPGERGDDGCYDEAPSSVALTILELDQARQLALALVRRYRKVRGHFDPSKAQQSRAHDHHEARMLAFVEGAGFCFPGREDALLVLDVEEAWNVSLHHEGHNSHDDKLRARWVGAMVDHLLLIWML